MDEKPRPKTETIKERAIYVYLPSHEMVKEWKDLAEKQGISISKFVIEHVENSLGQEEPSYLSRADLLRRMRELEEEGSKLKEDNHMLRLVIERLDDELKHYRAKPFLEEFRGIRGYEKELIDVLKKKGTIGSDEILDALGIDPKDSDLVKAVSTQLENLEAYGLIETMPRGWRWKG